MNSYSLARKNLQNIMNKYPPTYTPTPLPSKGKNRPSKMDEREINIEIVVYFDCSGGEIRSQYHVDNLSDPQPLQFTLTFKMMTSEDEVFRLIINMINDHMEVAFTKDSLHIYKKNRKILKKHLYGGSTKFNGYGMKNLTTKDSNKVYFVVKWENEAEEDNDMQERIRRDDIRPPQGPLQGPSRKRLVRY